MALYQRFAHAIDRHLPKGGRIVVGFSGGVDSRVLLRLTSQYCQQNTATKGVAVHVHHGLSANADLWLTQCADWADEEGLAFAAERVCLDTSNGDSIEQQARRARYQALSKHLLPTDILVTGQHLDDQTETFLLALKRGSGPKGLSSMAESMALGAGKLVRPLLNVARDEIEQFAVREQLSWVEDESNQDTRFDRNFLRQTILPEINLRWPGFATSVSRSARLCAKQEQLLEELLLPELENSLDEFSGLCINTLRHFSSLKREQLLRFWIAKHAETMPSEVQLSQLWREVAMARRDANPEVVLSGGSVRRFQDRLYWVRECAEVVNWHKSWTCHQPLTLPDDLGRLFVKPANASSELTLDYATLTNGVDVVFDPQGLSAHPQGRIGSRKLKKLYQEYKVPSWERRRIPVILQQGKVVAVGNLFVDKAFYGSDCELVWDK
ncbi:tRNA lysidine(34) synthetase TilS [Vibrio parahaemolyticus]|uniref:tRNA lysidine(34) synthetase TilS n=1 Tax=Vibrio mediterranei TaxID=689 RepID=UPI004067FB19